MWLLAFILIFPCWAQDDQEAEDDLKTLQELENELPTSENIKPGYTTIDEEGKPPVVPIVKEEIERSDIGYGVIPAGRTIIRIADGKKFKITQSLTTKYYLQQDELGFKHLIDKNGNSLYMVDSPYVVNIKPELELYEPPLRYTTATKIHHANYDLKLNLHPELSMYAGVIQGDFMRDLFNDTEASKGTTTQYGLHYFTEWNLPVKVGAVVHYERSTYNLSGNGQINYSAFSFGPQFKSKDFDFLNNDFRVQTQFRISPFARAVAKNSSGSTDYQFNSADLLTSLEHPFHNRWGEFVLGFFFQSQWLNIKNQKRNVSISSSNETNKSLGLSFSQVFQ